MNLSDKLADSAVTRQIRLQRYGAGLRNRVISLLEDAATDIIAKLSGAKELTTFSRDRLQAQLSDIRQLIDKYYQDIQGLAAAELQDLARIEAEWSLKSINTAVGAEIVSAMPSEKVLGELAKDTLIMGAPSKDWWARQSGDMQFRFVTAMRMGLAQGETNSQLVKRFRETTEISKRNAQALVRTSVQTVAAEARRATMRENDDVVKGIQQVSSLDGRTTDICIAYSGASWDLEGNPINSTALPYNGGIPRHWNAVAAGEMVTTARGQVAIESVRVGDLVMTHRGRFKPVTAVMRKRNESGFVRVINLESGRTIRVTDEHPVLATARGWIRADMLKSGDELFQYQDQPVPIGVLLGIAERNPNNYPSLFDAGEVFSQVLIEPGSMALSIKLQDDLTRLKSEISNTVADNHLPGVFNSDTIEPCAKQNLSNGKFGKLVALSVFQDSINSAIKTARVSLLHSLGMVRIIAMRLLGLTPCPMILSTQSAGCVNSLDCHGRSIITASNSDSVPFAPPIKNADRNALFSLNLANRFTRTEMFIGDKFSDGRRVSEVNHFSCGKVNDIRIVAHNDDVFNIAVQDDETYLIDGVIVHNCRSTEIPILKTFSDIGLDIDEFPKGTRASMDGQVAADLSFDDFLKSKPKSFQDDLLGPGRAELWRDKKITLTDLVDGRGNPLTLEQLRKISE